VLRDGLEVLLLGLLVLGLLGLVVVVLLGLLLGRLGLVVVVLLGLFLLGRLGLVVVVLLGLVVLGRLGLVVVVLLGVEVVVGRVGEYTGFEVVRPGLEKVLLELLLLGVFTLVGLPNSLSVLGVK